jgi:septum formation protein
MRNDSTNSLPPIILASASPRRIELLGRLGITFEVAASDVREDEILEMTHRDISGDSVSKMARKAVRALARSKARAVLTDRPGHLVIGADTVVVTEEAILGKPSSPDEAAEMLFSLCGRKHRVYTAVAILSDDMERIFISKTSVTFRPRDDHQEALIRKYVATGLPLDKAGGYGIQDMGALLISKIKGDYYTVVGLPISRLARELAAFGYRPSDGLKDRQTTDKGGLVCPD